MSDSRNLPDWINGFLDLTEQSEPPRMFRKWAAISTVASALQRKVRLELGISLTFYPNLFVVLVGPSATGKGTVMRYASDIMEQVKSIKISAQATSLQALIRRMKETNLTDIDLETGEQQYHSSLTIFSTEFTVFLGYHNSELISALCDWYDCQSRWSYETISRKKEEIIGVWVNLLAGTTPDSIKTSLPIESIGGGLTSRIIFVYEEKREKVVIIPDVTEKEITLQQHLIQDLEQISLMSGTFGFTKEFVDIYTDWRLNDAACPPFHDKKFDGYCGRRKKHLLTLAMICSASRSNSMMLEAEDVTRAAALLDEVEVKMPLTFRGLGRSDLSATISDAIVFIENSETPDIPLWQFARYFEGQMDKFEMDRVLFTLETMNLIKMAKRPGADTIIHRLADH